MGQIKVEKNAGGIEGLCVIEPTVHGDSRGYFMETYNQRRTHTKVQRDRGDGMDKGSSQAQEK